LQLGNVKMNSAKKILAGCAGIALIALILLDSKAHFDPSLIQAKRKHQSAQKNWNLFYGQNYNFADSSMRYRDDIAKISSLLAKGFSVISDMATSYYIASSSQAYVINIQRHHGAAYTNAWNKLIRNKTLCNLGQLRYQSKLAQFFYDQRSRATKFPVKYLIVNNDTLNKNVRLDCLWQRRQSLVENIKGVSRPIYQGDFLTLYELDIDN